MKPYSSVKAMLELSCIYFSVIGQLGKFGKIGSKYRKFWRWIYKKWSSVFNSIFHLSNEALLNGKSHLRILVDLENENELGKLWQILQIMDMDTQKVIQCVNFHILHQRKCYSGVKTIWGSSYTCFRIF